MCLCKAAIALAPSLFQKMYKINPESQFSSFLCVTLSAGQFPYKINIRETFCSRHTRDTIYILHTALA